MKAWCLGVYLVGGLSFFFSHHSYSAEVSWNVRAIVPSEGVPVDLDVFKTTWIEADPDDTPRLSDEMEDEMDVQARLAEAAPEREILDSPLTGRRGLATSDPRRQAGGLTVVRPYKASDYDPFKTMMQWSWGSDVSVGKGLQELSKMLGYTLIIRDQQVANSYAMRLPYTHRAVRNVDAKTALELLGGPALMVVVDHVNRTIMHRVKDMYIAKYSLTALPRCSPDLSYGTRVGSIIDKVLMVGGSRCVY